MSYFKSSVVLYDEHVRIKKASGASPLSEEGFYRMQQENKLVPVKKTSGANKRRRGYLNNIKR